MWGCILNNSYPRHCAVRRSYEKLYVGEKKKKKKKAHHIHRWLPNPRQMSKGLTWQPEHLWKRAQRGEHDGFTDGCMCREMMKKPSQMSLYHFVFMDKTICVCVLKWPQMKMLPFGSECFYLLDGSKTGTSVFFFFQMKSKDSKLCQKGLSGRRVMRLCPIKLIYRTLH